MNRLTPQQLQWIGKGGLAAGIGLFAFSLIFIAVLNFMLPPVSVLEDPDYSLPTKIFDRNGVRVDEVFIKRRKLVTFEQIPPGLINGLLAKEDTRFYQHHGIDPLRIVKAAWVNLITFSTAQGASTLTQQTARQFFLTLEKSWIRKISEVLLAFKIELQFSKKEILTLYLNKVNFGDAWGVSAAAEFYFSKKVEELSLSEAATLVGVLPAPNRYKPNKNPVQARKQRNIVLQRMREEGFINDAEYLAATSEPIVVVENQDTAAEAAAYYVELVRRILLQQFGSKSLYEGGLNVYTAMDFNYQKAAHAALLNGIQELDRRRGYRGPEDTVELDADGKIPADVLESLNTDGNIPLGRITRGVVIDVTNTQARIALAPDAEGLLVWDDVRQRWPIRLDPETDEPTANSSLKKLVKPGDLLLLKVTGRDQGSGKLTLDLHQEADANGAVYAMDPRSGDVLAVVGGVRFGRGDGASEFIRATQAERQPGSAFKPIIYAAAIDEGYTPATVLDDSPRVFTLGSGKKHIPQNYDNTYMGRMTFREALTRSRNVPTVQLVDEIGARKVIQFSRKLGISTSMPEESIIALGTHSVRMWELTRAYSVFASGGNLVTPVYVLKITDAKGNLLYQGTPKTEPVIAPETAYLVTDVLRDVVRSPAGTAHTALSDFKRPIAAKTGTTQEYSDAWFVGFIPQLVTSVYVGFDDPSRSLGRGETGGRTAAPIWAEFMEVVERSLPVETFAQPPSVVSFRVNGSGQFVGPCDDAGGSRLELFKASAIPARLQDAAGCSRAVFNAEPPPQSPQTGKEAEDVDL